jgi:hypothetical protein
VTASPGKQAKDKFVAALVTVGLGLYLVRIPKYESMGYFCFCAAVLLVAQAFRAKKDPVYSEQLAGRLDSMNEDMRKPATWVKSFLWAMLVAAGVFLLFRFRQPTQ